MHTASEMAPCAPIIVWKVKYPLCFVVNPCSTHTSISNQELFKKHLCNPCIPKKEMVPRAPSYYQLSEKWSIHYASLSAMFNPLHSSTNQELFEKHLCYQNSHYENTDDFRYEGKPSCAIAKSTLFAVSKDEWDTKEDTGKSMKNALYVLWYAKRHLSGPKRRRTVKKIKPVALAVIELRLSEGISQSVLYSVSRKFC